jgi:hypothetical protein
MKPSAKILEGILVLASQVPVDIPTLMGRVARAVLEERERCAQIVGPTKDHLPSERAIRRRIAAEVRSG